MCVVCQAAPSSRSGEHVWPMWFLRMFDGEGPFHVEVDGVPQVKRDGALRTHTNLQGTRVPMCTACNEALGNSVEVSAKDIIRSARDDDADSRWMGLDREAVAAVAEWFAKVALLSKHPDVSHDDPVMDRQADRWDHADPALYSWLAEGTGLPDGVSIFASRKHDNAPERPAGRIRLPRLVQWPSGSQALHHTEIGVLDLSIEIVHHGAWSIQHPRLGNGYVQLWPDPPNGAALAALEFVNPDDLRYLVSGEIELWPGVDIADLPALAVDLDWFRFVSAGLARMVSA